METHNLESSSQSLTLFTALISGQHQPLLSAALQDFSGLTIPPSQSGLLPSLLLRQAFEHVFVCVCVSTH